MGHTALPWAYNGRMTDALGNTIRVDGVAIPGGEDVEAATNAEFIVRACNAHDALLKALQELRAALDPDDWIGAKSMHDFIDAALSKAGST